jgi:hypothetical protein
MLTNTPRRPGSSRTGGVLYGIRMSGKVLLFVVSRQGGDSRSCRSAWLRTRCETMEAGQVGSLT